MRSVKTDLTFALALAAFFATTVRSETCYSYMGFEVEDQQFCKGSGACCGVNDQCMPNRLCRSRGSADNVLVRGPCSSESWDKERNCAEICNFSTWPSVFLFVCSIFRNCMLSRYYLLLDEVEQNTGLQDSVFPRVEICDEGVYCCRQGSASCCDRESRLVFLNEDGARLSSQPLSTASTTIAASAADFEAISTQSGSTQSSSTAPKEYQQGATQSDLDSEEDDVNRGDASLGLKVGLGVGIPLAISVTALVTWCFVSRRKRDTESHVVVSELAPDETYASTKHQTSPKPRVLYGQMAQPYHFGAIARDTTPAAQELEAPPYAR